MAVLTIRDILLGQTTLDTIILRRLRASASAQKLKSKTPTSAEQTDLAFKYVFIPLSYLEKHTPSSSSANGISASATGVQPTFSLAAPTPLSTSTSFLHPDSSPDPNPRGFVCPVYAHERLYDLGPRENWRHFVQKSSFWVFGAGKSGKREGEGEFEWPEMNREVLGRMVREIAEGTRGRESRS